MEKRCINCEMELNDFGNKICEDCESEYKKFIDDQLIIIEEIAERITDKIFNDIWKENKKELRNSDKIDLAKEMFYAGVFESFLLIIPFLQGNFEDYIF